MKTFILILMCLLICSTLTFAEESVKMCGTMEYLKKQMKDNPELEAQMAQFEEQVQLWIKDNYKGKKHDMLQSNITIPVVVHILYCTDDQDIPDDRIKKQIEITNNDYAGQNPHPMGAFASYLKANTGIQFVLAQKTPDGRSTNGIERRQTTVSSFPMSYNDVKFTIKGGLDAWDPKLYFNIWVCNLEVYGGYAQFPGTGVNATFGIVVRYPFFGLGGSYQGRNNGGVNTHEIGHCLNLRHTWGDDQGACTGTDYVEDTPNQGFPTLGFYGGAITDDCSNSTPGIMYMNFMDYTNDECWSNFTPNQTERMLACFASPGGPLLSLANSSTGSLPTNCETPTSIQLQFISKFTATLGWTSMFGATSYNIHYRKSGATIWITSNPSSNTVQLTGLAKNTPYEFQVQTVTSQACSSSYSSILSFRTLNQDPSSSISAPALVSPSDNATGLDLKPTFTWNSVANATSYILEISQNSDFTESMQVRTTGTTTYTNGLSYGKSYHWRVKAVNSSFSGSWSGPRSFSTLAPTLSMPVLVYPADQAGAIPTSPTLTWNAVENATGYVLQYSTDNFTTFTIVNTDQLSATLENLSISTIYYWRVKAVNGDEFSPWAQRLFGTVNPFLSAPLLLSPENNSLDISVNSAVFSWNAVPNASYYIFQYSVDAVFNTISGGVITTVNTANVAGLNINTVYYWRVKAYVSETYRGYSSDWSEIFTFRTVNLILLAPILVSPVNRATNVSTNTALSWGSVQFATSYIVQYSINGLFTDFDPISTTQTSVNLSGLSPNQAYVWRVQAVSGQTQGPWSEQWLFTTQNVNLSPPTLLSPANNSTRISTNPTMSWSQVDNATYYSLEYSTSSSFNPPPIPVSPIYTTNTTLTGLARNATYYWRVKAHYDGIESGWSTVFKFKTSASGKIGSDDFTAGEIVSDNITLIVYPNPLSTKALFEIQVPKSEFVNLVIYDIYGKEIVTLANGQLSPGIHDFEFDAKGMPSGVYYCILQAGDYSESMKLMIIQ